MDRSLVRRQSVLLAIDGAHFPVERLGDVGDDFQCFGFVHAGDVSGFLVDQTDPVFGFESIFRVVVVIDLKPRWLKSGRITVSLLYNICSSPNSVDNGGPPHA